MSFQRFPGLTSSTLRGGSGRHPSVRSHQLWCSASGSCPRSEGCRGEVPGLPGAHSLLAQRGGFGLVCPALLQTAVGLHQRTPRADSSERQEVDSPRGAFPPAGQSKDAPTTRAAETRTLPPTAQPHAPKRGTDEVGLHVPLTRTGTKQLPCGCSASSSRWSSWSSRKASFCAAWQSKRRKRRC